MTSTCWHSSVRPPLESWQALWLLWLEHAVEEIMCLLLNPGHETCVFFLSQNTCSENSEQPGKKLISPEVIILRTWWETTWRTQKRPWGYIKKRSLSCSSPQLFELLLLIPCTLWNRGKPFCVLCLNSGPTK